MSLDRRFSFFYMLILYGVQGTLMPSGTVAVDCSGQQAFTCDVTGVTTDPAAGWIIMGLFNISASGSNGVVTDNRNPRITGTGGNVPTSTITIADFTMSDNGGTVKCINTEDDSDQGTATISVGVPPPLVNVSAQLIEDTSVRITWDQPSNNPPVTSVTVTCMPSSTNCETCPPSGPCTIRGLASNTTYVITVTPKNKCGDGSARSVNVTTNFTASPPPTNPGIPIVAIVVPIVAAIILVVLVVIIVIVVVIWCMKKKHSVKDNSSARMSRLRSNEERANLGEDTYASPGTEKPQPETTDGVYSYAATETKIGAQMKEREQQKKQPPPQGDFYEEPNAAKNVQHKTGTITGETYAQPDKPKRGTKKKDKQQKEPVPHKETPAGELYAMPDKKKDVSHTSGPVTGDEYAVASKPKTGGGYGAHGPQ